MMAIKEVKYVGTKSRAAGNRAYAAAFRRAKARLARGKVAFVEIENPLELYLFEVYAAMKLDTSRWNTFATH
jgi:hypothetical protein